MFNYYFWEPIWYYDPIAPKLTSKLKKARWLGIAPNCGDALTYYINTENEQGKNRVIVRSVIKTRRKNIGTDKEFINEDPETSDFYIDENFEEKDQEHDNHIRIEELNKESDNDDNNNDNEEQENDNIPPEEATNI